MKYTERIYSESEIKLIEEIFDMYIKQIYDEDFEKLINDCKKMFLEHQKSLKEIERLNNIINELEKYLEKIIIDGGTIGSMTFWYRQIYDYLQELKGDDKE